MERDSNSIHKNIIREQDLKRIVELLETIQYGSLTVIVQDGKLLQLERNEKIRIR